MTEQQERASQQAGRPRQRIRLGAGAGFAGDRIDPAVELAQYGDLDYLIFECLGERTVAAGQSRRREDPGTGYDPLLVARIGAVIDYTLAAGTTIITNGGSANPLAAADAVATMLSGRRLSRSVTIAAVTGDDVTDAIRTIDPLVWETGKPVSVHATELLSANAYIGAEALLPALQRGVDILIVGRAADPSLYLAPMMHEFGWDAEDAELLGKGTCVGHLLECAGQLTGGYFADPGPKDVPGLARLGFPFADVSADGSAVVGKLERSGGLLDVRTCREQLLYEVHDPHAYLTPDVTADFSRVAFTAEAPDRVRVTGPTGSPRPQDLKVSLGFRGGWTGEGQISYAGPRAEARARLAADVVVERLQTVHGLSPDALTVELIGTGSAFRGAPGARGGSDTTIPEVRLRVSGVLDTQEQAEAVRWEVESLYTNGPAGGGGARGTVTEVVAIRAASLPREAVPTSVHIQEVPQ
ncbi:MAG TPA: acyclic terpene utilization AtuA family protein [Brevibacterium sp.]|nr:acyclic terpene utilization AtuA family protein [Brevibacterium sp.]